MATSPLSGASTGSAGAAQPPLARARELANKLTPIQKITLGAVLLTVIAGGLVLSRTSDTVPMTALYTDLSSADASSVVDSLAARGVNYDLTDAGRTVLVPKTDVYDLRIALAGEGLPSSNEGYALLDNQGITTSEFRQRIDYQRALEGELAMTLTALDGVQSASVHLALPDDSVFIDEPATPTASVLVAGTSIGGIGAGEVEAIVHLVASSVKDMKPGDVTVIDANGTVLSAGGTGGGIDVGVGGKRAKATAEFESRMNASIMALLTRFAGPNKVAVTVTADLDLDETQLTSEDYGPIGDEPEDPLVLAETTNLETYGSAGNPNGADTGVLGPDGGVIAPDITPDPSATNTDYLKESADTQYAIDRIVKQTTEVPGDVNKLGIAVLVDEATVTEEQAAAIEEMVATAAGIDAERGDSIIVTRMPFDASASTQADEMIAAEEKAAAKAQMMDLARTAAILLVIIIALILGYRSAKNARKLTVTPINIGEITTGPRPSLGPGSAGEPGAVFEPVPIAISKPPDNDAVVLNELTMMADRKPQEVANVLKAWLAETKGRRP
jgi:flagellar M-ring protein FliF